MRRLRWEGSPSQIKITGVFEGAESGEELDEGLVVVGPGSHLEDQVGVGAVGFVVQRPGHRESFPVEPVPQDRGAVPTEGSPSYLPLKNAP
jgi:hypothetical protein